MTDSRRYRIVISRAAARDLRRMHRRVLVRVDAAIQNLADNPHPAQSIKIEGMADTYRLRVGEYRIVYHIDAGHLTILILRAAPRGDAY